MVFLNLFYGGALTTIPFVLLVLADVNIKSFDRCTRDLDLRYSRCSIPDVGFPSLIQPLDQVHGSMLTRIAFIGDSFVEQIHVAFQCLKLDVRTKYFTAGVKKMKMCPFLSGNWVRLGKDHFDVIILSEGLWFNPHILQENGMLWEDYVNDVACAINNLQQMQADFLWIQKPFQHFNTKEGIIPTRIRHLNRKELRKYSKCVQLERPERQIRYHEEVFRLMEENFPGRNISEYILKDLTKEFYMLHTKYQRTSRSIPDCTHFCQKSTGVPVQYARSILERINFLSVRINKKRSEEEQNDRTFGVDIAPTLLQEKSLT